MGSHSLSCWRGCWASASVCSREPSPRHPSARALGRGGELRRSDMFIVRPCKQNRRKPHRGGMGPAVAVHAAPMGLGWIAGRGGTVNMSPRWGLAQAGGRVDQPNRAAAGNLARRTCAARLRPAIA